MNLRSITSGFNIARENNDAAVKRASELISEARKAFEDRYPNIRTTRFCSQPLIEVDGLQPEGVAHLVKEIDRLCKRWGIGWFCTPIGECYEGEHFEFVKKVPEVVRGSNISFSNVIVTQGRRVSLEAVNECARQVKKISRTSRNGFDNFRFCVSANAKPNGSFFPYSWHRGEDGFSIGLETVDLILKNVSRECDLSETRRGIIEALSREFEEIDRVAKDLEDKTGLKYHGLDLSLAPYPTSNQSIARAVQRLGVERFGANGTLFLTAYLTNILKHLEEMLPIRTVGFKGVMYPVLEDRFLAESNDRGMLSMESLLLYSAVCGCGPDMIPLPGDVSEKEIASIILDMSSLALLLDKPLMSRLVLIPNKKGGRRTEFNYHFLSNTKVMDSRNLSLTGRLLRKNINLEFL